MGRFQRRAPSPHQEAHRWSVLSSVVGLGGSVCLFLAVANHDAGLPLIAGVDGIAIAFTMRAYGRHLGRRAATRVLAFNAFRQILGGDLDEAERLLGQVPRRQGPSAPIIDWHRARICLYDGRPKDAAELASRALASAAHHRETRADRGLLSLIRGVRALAHATAGDAARAEADALAIFADAESPPHAVAQCELARAITDARRGDAALLAARLGAQGSEPTRHLAPQETAMFLALRRTARLRSESAYRAPELREDDAPAAACPVTDRWLAIVLGDECRTADCLHGQSDRRTGRVEAQAKNVARHPHAASSELPRLTWWTRLQQADGTDAGTSLAYLTILAGSWAMLRFEAPAVTPWPPLGALVAAMVPLVVLGWLFAIRVRRRKPHDRPLHELLMDFAQLGHASPKTASEPRPAALEDDLSTATQLERDGEFERALAIGDRAIWRLDASDDSVAAEVLLPQLLALRAAILPVIGNPAEAERELDALERDYPDAAILPRVRWQVKLRCALARQDATAALALAKTRQDLGLATRDEALALLVLAANSAAADTELAHLESALSERHVQRFVDRAAPGLRKPTRLGRSRTRIAPDLVDVPLATEEHAPDVLDPDCDALRAKQQRA